MKIKTVKPSELGNCNLGSGKCPNEVIELVPMVKKNVGIGWVTDRVATPTDMKKIPFVERPWIDFESLGKGGGK